MSGQALLATLTPEDVDRRYAEDHRQLAGDGIGIDVLHRRLDRIRRERGLALSHAEQCSMGISSVSAPVLGPHGAVAAISVVSRRTVRLNALAPVVAAAARATSQRLFPNWRDHCRAGACSPRR